MTDMTAEQAVADLEQMADGMNLGKVWYQDRLEIIRQALSAPRVPANKTVTGEGGLAGTGLCDALRNAAQSPAEASRTQIEMAHMAGQADAGVDPSYSSARSYASRETKDSSIGAVSFISRLSEKVDALLDLANDMDIDRISALKEFSDMRGGE